MALWPGVLRQLFDFRVEVSLYLPMKICPLTGFLILPNKPGKQVLPCTVLPSVISRSTNSRKAKASWEKNGYCISQRCNPLHPAVKGKSQHFFFSFTIFINFLLCIKTFKSGLIYPKCRLPPMQSPTTELGFLCSQPTEVLCRARFIPTSSRYLN